MLSLLSHEEMMSIIAKSFVLFLNDPTYRFKPGTTFYDDFMGIAANDKRFSKMFVFDMSYNVTEDDLRISFEKFGKISNISIQVDSDKKSKGYGFIQFEEPMSCLKAFEESVVIDVLPLHFIYM